MDKIKIPLGLALLLLRTNKSFLVYNVDKDKKQITDYRLTDTYELTGNNRNYSNYKLVSCIKNKLTYIEY